MATMKYIFILLLVNLLPVLVFGHVPYPVSGYGSDGPVESDTLTRMVIEGQAEPSDRYTYRLESFQVPEGTGQLNIAFEYNSYRNEVEIGLFDPHRFRGTSRFSKSSFMVAETRATASYLPGPLPAGTWQVSLGFPVINLPVNYKITIELIPRTHPLFTGPDTLILTDEAGWYQGDFHTHTGHSDGFGCRNTLNQRTPCQVYKVAQAAHRRGLDFVAIADHNTISHQHEMWVLQPQYPDMLLLPSQEVTTFYGHATVHGTRLPMDFRFGYEGYGMPALQDSVARAGALLSIVHPGRPTGDSCTGCGWSAEATDFSRVEAIEIVNGTQVETDISGIPFWHKQLNEGHRITAIGGSDDHGAGQGSDQPGTPTTVVYARNLSEFSLLEGVRSGSVYVKTTGPELPDADFFGVQNEQRVEMGETASALVPFSWATHIHADHETTLEVIVNGEVAHTNIVPAGSDAPVSIPIVLPEDGGWVRANVRHDDRLILISNPIYFR